MWFVPRRAAAQDAGGSAGTGGEGRERGSGIVRIIIICFVLAVIIKSVVSDSRSRQGTRVRRTKGGLELVLGEYGAKRLEPSANNASRDLVHGSAHS